MKIDRQKVHTNATQTIILKTRHILELFFSWELGKIIIVINLVRTLVIKTHH